MAKLNWLLVIIVTAAILTVGLNKPMYGHHDWNGVYYANIARNYFKLGLIKTKLGQATSTGSNPAQLNYYTHYPPLLPWSIAISYQLLGISDLATRLVPVIYSFFTILVLHQIALAINLSSLASLAAMAVIFTPMFRYFSHMPDQEPLVILFTLLSLYYYLVLTKTPTKKAKLKFYLSVVFNSLSAWGGYFLYPLLALHSYLYHRRLFKTLLKAILITIIVFLLHLTHTYVLTGSFFGGGLIKALLLRLNISHLQGKPDPSLRQFTLKKYLIQQARWLTVYYTRPLLLTGLAFLSACALKLKTKKPLNQTLSIILLLFFWGLAYPVIFSNVVFIHEYFNIFFLPFLALSLGWLIHRLQARSQPLALILALILTLAIYFERLPFYKALQATQAHQPGHQLGQLINQSTPTDQPALVFASRDFLGNQEPFIKFYADRPIKLANYDPTDWLEAQTNLLPDTNQVFTVTANQPQLFIDQALATQSAIIKSFADFNYYQLP